MRQPTPAAGKKIPVDASPDLLRSHPQGDADGRPGDHIGGVVDLHVDPARGHDAREAVPEGLLGQRAAVGEQRRGDEGRRGVAAREAARERLAKGVRAIALVHGPRAAEQTT